VRKTNHRLFRAVTGLVVVLAIGIAVPAAASAQQVSSGPTADQYDPPNVQVQTAAGGSDEGTGLTDPVGPLPFTGFDVIAMLGVALAVTGLGLGLQRAVSRQSR
jgi:hypothetical protein